MREINTSWPKKTNKNTFQELKSAMVSRKHTRFLKSASVRGLQSVHTYFQFKSALKRSLCNNSLTSSVKRCHHNTTLLPFWE